MDIGADSVVFACDVAHTWSPMDEISISVPQVEHLMAGKMLAGLRVSILAYELRGGWQ